MLRLMALPSPQPFEQVIEKKPVKASMINQEYKEVLAELQDKYCPLYELKFHSGIEDIEIGLADVAHSQK